MGNMAAVTAEPGNLQGMIAAAADTAAVVDMAVAVGSIHPVAELADCSIPGHQKLLQIVEGSDRGNERERGYTREE